VTEHADEGFEPWPGEVDPIKTALLPVIEHVFAVTVADSPARRAALDEVLAVAGRIRAALAKPTLN
jgi:hypothetical protein